MSLFLGFSPVCRSSEDSRGLPPEMQFVLVSVAFSCLVEGFGVLCGVESIQLGRQQELYFARESHRFLTPPCVRWLCVGSRRTSVHISSESGSAGSGSNPPAGDWTVLMVLDSWTCGPRSLSFGPNGSRPYSCGSCVDRTRLGPC